MPLVALLLLGALPLSLGLLSFVWGLAFAPGSAPYADFSFVCAHLRGKRHTLRLLYLYHLGCVMEEVPRQHVPRVALGMLLVRVWDQFHP